MENQHQTTLLHKIQSESAGPSTAPVQESLSHPRAWGCVAAVLLSQPTLHGTNARNASSCLYPEPWIAGGRVLHPGGARSHGPGLPSPDRWEQWAAARGRHFCRAAHLWQQDGEMCRSPWTTGECCWRPDIKNRIGRSEIVTLHLKEWNGRKLKRFGQACTSRKVFRQLRRLVQRFF